MGGPEVLVGDEQYAGVTVYPITVGMLIKNAGVFKRIKDACKEGGISLDSFSKDPFPAIEKLLPVAPEVLQMVTRKSSEEIEAMGLDVAAGVLVVSLRQNMGYIRKLFGPILQTVKQETESVEEPIT